MGLARPPASRSSIASCELIAYDQSASLHRSAIVFGGLRAHAEPGRHWREHGGLVNVEEVGGSVDDRFTSNGRLDAAEAGSSRSAARITVLVHDGCVSRLKSFREERRRRSSLRRAKVHFVEDQSAGSSSSSDYARRMTRSVSVTLVGLWRRPACETCQAFGSRNFREG